jgi:uncharacterized protein (DUF58 family)
MKKGWWGIIGLLLLVSVVLRHDLLFLMALLLGLIGEVSYIWARYCLAGVTCTRRFGTTRLFHGEETDLYVEIVNAKPLPLPWLRVEDEFPGEMQLLTARLDYSHFPGRRRLVNLVSLRWYERVRRRYRLRGRRRGAWVFGPAEMVSGDIFGLDVKRETLPETQTVLVYPKVVPLISLGLPARHPFGDLRAPRRILEDPLRLMSTRDYRPGDNFRYIHWKASARRQALHTKVFEPSASRPLAVFLNINTFEFIYEGLDLELQELAVTAAASIARYAWEQGHQIGLYVNSVTQPGGARVRIRPARHPDQLAHILEALARIVEYGHWPIEAVLEVEHPRLPYGATIVVITAVISDRLRRMLPKVRRREYAPALVALGEARLDAPLPGVQYYHIGGREVWRELESLALGQ